MLYILKRTIKKILRALGFKLIKIGPPHTHVELASNKWNHKYEREEAAYPSEFLKTFKYWPPVARVDNVYGDKNLFCSCPSMDEYKNTAA